MHPQIELETAVSHNNKVQEDIVNGKRVKEPPVCIKIFRVLGDGAWHNKAEFIRPWSSDLRRLQEMRSKDHWIEYETRDVYKDGKLCYTEYRITKIWDTWWEEFKKYDLFAMGKSGQMEMAGVRG